LVLETLYSPFLSTWDWAESAGQPDLRLQEGAEIAISTRKKAKKMFFIAVKIGLLAYVKQGKPIKSGISAIFNV
jgi:phosphotransacetylase